MLKYVNINFSMPGNDKLKYNSLRQKKICNKTYLLNMIMIFYEK